MATLLLKENQAPASPVAERRRPAELEPVMPGVWLILGLILAGAWYLRASDFHYSSAFMDESIYIVYGRMFLTHHFEAPIDQPLHWSFGWYLWPAMAAIADAWNGLAGVRELAAALGTMTVLAVFGFARRLFSPAVGLSSAAVFAMLGPAVYASRIATRDCACIAFLALGLWAYAAAWQKNRWRIWVAAALWLFAAFLTKYLVAMLFPFLALLALAKGRKPFLFFSSLLTLLCAGYVALYAQDFEQLLRYGSAFSSLQANPTEAWAIYVTRRADFWALAVLALLAWPLARGRNFWTASLLWLGATVLLAFQWRTRADYDYWKHATYPLLFLTPLAMEGVIRFLKRLTQSVYPGSAVIAVTLLTVSLGWAGNSWRMDKFLFWPNVEPIVAALEGRLAPESNVLVDDSVFRYYFSPPLGQAQIADPFYFHYGEASEENAYARAVRDGYFDYVILDGGIGEEARRLRAVIQPELAARYQLRLQAPDAVLGRRLEVYERQNPPAAKPPAPSGPQVDILVPRTGEMLATKNSTAVLQGVASGAARGSYVRPEVYTNRWYPEGAKISLNPADGSFSQTIYLGGEGETQCQHIVRVRLFDPDDRLVASAVSFGIVRANPDNSAPACRSETATIPWR